MRKKVLCVSRGIFFCFSLVLFSLFTIFLIFTGSFYWDGGNSAYLNTNTVLRGIELLSGTLLLFCLFGLAVKALGKMEKEKIRAVTAVFGLLMIVFQFLFVAAAKAGIRYDALKVMDEALALFSQRGMQAADLEGYFARYSNNYAMTIMTHWIIKIFRLIGIIRPDFSNAVLLLQFVNIIFADTAFAGAYALLKRFVGDKAGAVFVIYMALNPLSYVWMPFYYTNTCSMAFAVWGAYLLISVFVRGIDRKRADDGEIPLQGKNGFLCNICKCALAGILFAAGFEIRATVGIALIAAVITIGCFGEAEETGQERAKKTFLRIAVYLAVLFFSMGITAGIYGKIENHYLAFDESDSEFPMTHWIAMGLSDTGTFSPADEAYTMSFADREGKKEATVSLLKERAAALGPAGVAKLYFKKLAMTFGDGAGGYHSELNISRDYGLLWQIVYGVHRDPLLSVTQIFYLLSLVSGAGMAVLLWKRKLHGALFFLPLLLLGSYLFQMIWEAGTIYSIGTMYVNGCVTAAFIAGIFIKDADNRDKGKVVSGFWRERKRTKVFFYGLTGFCVLMCSLLVRSLFVTEYVEVSMSVDQFLFQANEYTALSEGMEIVQTFVTDKEFSTIALQVHNPEGEFNDSLYSVRLCDGEGALIKEELLEGALIKDYTFYPLAFSNETGVSNYEIRISKLSGKNDLVFLYYDTGHYDVYPEGKMTGLTKGDMADLIFEVYWREEMESPDGK